MVLKSSAPPLSRTLPFVLVFLALFVTGCEGYDVEVSYQPFGLPVEVTINDRGEIFISAVESIVTPLGAFSAGLSPQEPLGSIGGASPGGTQQVGTVRAYGCSVPIASEFRWLWTRAGGTAVGCPAGLPYQRRVAIERFERAFMIWHAGPYGDAGGTIYVIYYDGRWYAFRDQWREGMPESAGYTPPSGLVEPRRGFGHLWARMGGPKAPTGWALEPERGYDAGLIQDFQGGGVIIRVPYEITLFLLPGGTGWIE